jgi:Dyp-type peroxidase family
MPTPQEQLKELLTKPLQDADLQQEPLQTILQNVQGNILHSHGQDYAAHTFLQFQPGNQKKVKQWLRDYIIDNVTFAQAQLKERKDYPNPKDRKTLFVSCLLSASGYHFLEAPAPTLPKQFSKEFLCGMKKATDRLQDPPYTSWGEKYREDEEIHAMILLAHHDKKTLEDDQQKLVDNHILPLVARSWIEWGNVLRKGDLPDGPREEHFGFVDGHSQPLFFQQDLEKEKQKRGIDQWDPGAGPHLVLTPDPLGGPMDYGSYFVFRKLEQDVTLFETQARHFARTYGGDEEKAMALLVGRFRDGTPLVLDDAPTAPRDPEHIVPNNFRYDTDWDGQRCPFDAHIRRMNPRWAAGSLEYDRRIARRSIPYGTRGTKPVGLLFMCYQQDLKTQFEALQGKWAQTTPFALPVTRHDALIGNRQAQKNPKSSKSWASPRQVTPGQPISDWVTFKGGEYFFAPSISVLKQLF